MNKSTSYATMQRNTIKYMMGYINEYEQVRRKEHGEYKTVREFFESKGICYQNFYKFYSRFKASGRMEEALLPTRRGPKPRYKEMPIADDSLERKVLEYRAKGFNKFVIAEALKMEHNIRNRCSANTVYRIPQLYGVSRLTKSIKEEKRKIMREHIGSLGHVDCHYLPKGVVTSEPHKRYYAIGCIDDYSRLGWVEVIESTKAMDATFGMMDIIMLMNERYGVKFEEIMTDNGSEFCGGATKLMQHPFERLLLHFGMKHRRTKPYRPQTNGKIERFWRTFEEDVIEGAVFGTLDELKDAVLGYNFFYNEHRPHQGLGGKKPQDMLNMH